jgi:GNAT superfamily N-acetyltransferase
LSTTKDENVKNRDYWRVEILPVNRANLVAYGRIPIGFTVDSKIEIRRESSGLQGLIFREIKIDPPYLKDYDLEEKPVQWLKTFKMGNWRIFRALKADEVLGVAVVALKSPEVHMLDGRRDLAMIWDIRVKPALRGQGVGTRLFQNAADWAREQGCRQLKIETQNTNVNACHFYASRGCLLGEINFFKYTGSNLFKEDVMFCWYLNL